MTLPAPRVSRWGQWLMPSIEDVIFIVILLAVLFQGNGLLYDADTAWHIRTGDHILSTLEVPRTDIFSYRMYGQPWIDHEWLSEVIFAILHRTAGLNGVVVFSAFIIALTFFLLFKTIAANRINILITTSVTLLAMATAHMHWLARPHILSLLLTLIWYALLESHQRSPQKKHLYVFPGLMLAWVNLHPGYLLGFVLIFIYGMGNAMNYFMTREPDLQQRHLKRIRSLSLIALLSLLTALINPQGYRFLLFPIHVVSSTVTLNNIIEWQSPSFHQFSVYEFYLLFFLIIVLITPLKNNVIETGLILLSIYLSLFAARYIPLFAIFMAPILGLRLDHLFQFMAGYPFTQSGIAAARKRIVESAERIQSLNPYFKYHLAPIVLSLSVFFLAFNGGGVFGETILDYRFDEKTHPVRAVEFLKQNPLPGNMFNSYYFGGYLIYSLFPDPRYRVFVDGRGFVGGDEFGVGSDEYLKTYLTVDKITPEWRDTLEKYQVNWIIYQAGSKLSVLLLADPSWKLIYADETADIFVKNAPQNEAIIEQYPDVKPIAKKPDPDTH